jgi:hypothetical protein
MLEVEALIHSKNEQFNIKCSVGIFVLCVL